MSLIFSIGKMYPPNLYKSSSYPSACSIFSNLIEKKWELQIQQIHIQCDLLASSSDSTTASLQEMLWFPHDGFFGEVFAAIRYKPLSMHLWNKWISRCSTFVISHILGSYECFFYELTQFRSTFQPLLGGGESTLRCSYRTSKCLYGTFPRKLQGN